MYNKFTSLLAALILLSNVTGRSLQLPALHLANVLEADHAGIVYEVNTAVPAMYKGVKNTVLVSNALVQMSAKITEAKIAVVGGSAALTAELISKLLYSAGVEDLAADADTAKQVALAGINYGYKTIQSITKAIENGINKVFNEEIIKIDGNQVSLDELIISDGRQISILAREVSEFLHKAVAEMRDPLNYKDIDFLEDGGFVKGGAVPMFILKTLADVFDMDISNLISDPADPAQPAEEAAQPAAA